MHDFSCVFTEKIYKGLFSSKLGQLLDESSLFTTILLDARGEVYPSTNPHIDDGPEASPRMVCTKRTVRR